MLLLVTFAARPAAAAEPYFTLSTYKTFAPDEKPEIHLYTRNEKQLEFRIYHVQDEVKFVSALSELHSFGEVHNFGPVEQIDEKTWLERFHDWKQGLWDDIKDFVRTQLSHHTRQAVERKQSSLAQRSRIVGAVQFAQVPLLNDKQLVARWQQQVPPTFVSDNQILPIDPLPAGMYLMEATDGHLKAYTLLMVSEAAMVTRTVSGQIVAYVVDRKSGAPLNSADVTLALGKQPPLHQTTTTEGITTFNAPSKSTGEEGADAKLWVLAKSGKDIALVAPWFSSFTERQSEPYLSYTYTDRPVYRPGHTVYFKSILRARNGDTLATPKLSQVEVKIADEQQKVIFDKQLPVSAMGSVAGEVELPMNAALGGYTINVGQSDNVNGSGDFRVEEYRKPEYQVRVSAEKQRVLQGESDHVTIDARYFFGEPVADAKVKYRVYQNTHYWWDEGDDEDVPSAADDDSSSDNNDVEGSDETAEHMGKLNTDGKLAVDIPTSFVEKRHEDMDYVVEGAVTDEAGREITGRYRFLATYGSFRIHVEPLSYAVQPGQPARFRVTAVDYDNKPVQTAIHLHLMQYKGWSRNESNGRPAGETDVATGADGTATAEITPSLSGSMDVIASADTPEKRQVQDHAWLWVSGSSVDWGENQQAQIVTDKKSYVPGDTAHLTLLGQVDSFHALITATGYAVEFRKVLSTDGRSLSFDIPITRDSQPNLVVDAVFVKDGKVYQARKSLNIPPVQQRLQITVTPATDIFQPGQAAVYDVMARDASGAPVSAELSFGVVDEAIYSLYPDTSGDIVSAFYPTRGVYPELEDSLTYYFTGEAGERSPMLAERRSRFRPQLAQVKPDNDAKQPRVRKAFPDTAYWQPAVHTDAQGHARVTLNFPDSLTTWRATVRAITADSRAGSMVNRVIVRKNIIVRMGQPRFMRQGDTISVPVIVHNYLQQAKSIDLSLQVAGVEIVSGSPQKVTVAPRADASVRYQLRASAIGTATLTAKAISDEESDALEISLPVKPAGVAETLSGSGVLTGSAEHAESLQFPGSTDPASQALNVQVSPSIAGPVFSALDYLTSFPYGCTEQTMSSLLPNIIVAQALQQLKLPSHIDDNQLHAKIDAGLDRLRDYHHEDGGWGWWKEDQSQVFMTAYVVSGVAQARKAGYLRYMDQNLDGHAFLQRALANHPRMLPELRAYVVYALSEAGYLDTKQLDTLWSRRDDLSPQALAYTGLAMLDAKDSRATEIGKMLEQKPRIEGELASWPGSRNDLLDVDWDSSAETTAFALKLLAHTDPQSPLLTKAAQWLVANRNEGYWWSSTQQTAFVLYGLTDYLLVSHELSSDMDVEVFVNGVSVGRQHFSPADAAQGRTLSLQIDAAHLQPLQNSVGIVTHGSGRAYWSTQGTYFSTAKQNYQKGSMTLNIARDYYVLSPLQKDGKIVYQLKPLDGPVSQGDVLAVHLGITGSPQKYMLIEDPIPSGTEFVRQTDSYNIEKRPDTWDLWYTRQEFHDDRAAIFADEFSGRHDSFYLIQVTNAGSFRIDPARVAPMYQPGVQATTDALHLDVKEAAQ